MFYTSFLVLCPCFISQLNPQINTNTSSLMWIDTLYSVWIFLIWAVCVYFDTSFLHPWYLEVTKELFSKLRIRILSSIEIRLRYGMFLTVPLRGISRIFQGKRRLWYFILLNSSIIILPRPFSETHCIEKWLSHLNLYRGNIIYKGSECSKL